GHLRTGHLRTGHLRTGHLNRSHFLQKETLMLSLRLFNVCMHNHRQVLSFWLQKPKHSKDQGGLFSK
ncbi:MAG: hypothetical protein WCH11_07015, partial [Bdellovibrio sp.]